MTKISIIGYKNQASKLRSLLEQKKCQIDWIYHPEKNNFEKSTNNFSDLYDSDLVIIASPNETHYGYIETLLQDFSGYIFCEKPPVTNIHDLSKLENISEKDKKRIFFNFNLRFSQISKELKSIIKNDEMGKIIHINIISSKGLAFKKEYLDSWRANGSKNIHNILDSVTIHFIDLLNLYFENASDYHYQPSLFSKNGTSFDSVNLNLKYENNTTVSILNSYATPFYNEFSIIGTNGILLIKNEKIEFFSPRNTFDEKGYFKTPPKVREHAFNFEEEFLKSTESAIDYFLKIVNENRSIDMEFFDSSMKTTKLVLDIKSTFSKDF